MKIETAVQGSRNANGSRHICVYGQMLTGTAAREQPPTPIPHRMHLRLPASRGLHRLLLAMVCRKSAPPAILFVTFFMIFMPGEADIIKQDRTI